MPDTLVLLHGFTHTGASWEPVLAELGERYLAVAPDIRGHGAAGSLRPVTLAAVIDDVAAVGPAGAFTLAGYSMGGRIALHVALARPDRVGRLVLIGASPGLADPEEREARRRADERLADEVETMSIEAFAERWAGSTPVLAGQSARLEAGVRAAVERDRLRNTPSGLAAALRGLGTGALPSLWARLGELKMPVTLIAGELDPKFAGIGREMSEHIRQPDVVIVRGAGHAVHLEAPEAVAGAIDGTRRARAR